MAIRIKTGKQLNQFLKGTSAKFKPHADNKRRKAASLPLPEHPYRSGDGRTVAFTLPLLTKSQNGIRFTTRGGMMAHSKVVREQRMAACNRTKAWNVPMGSYRIALERMSSGTLDDDNLRSALKAARDGIADGLGFRDDSDKRLEWLYSQMKCPRGRYGVRVVIEVQP